MKKHEIVENQRRIDSLDADYKAFAVESGGRLTGERLTFFREDEQITLEDGQQIRLSYMRNRAGRQTFFLCPGCGRRVRFLYLPGVKCRVCKNLNYRSQHRKPEDSIEELADILGIRAEDLPTTDEWDKPVDEVPLSEAFQSILDDDCFSNWLLF